jgi:ubiquinone/menaquinone biosynthesis C-methylase UbiE
LPVEDAGVDAVVYSLVLCPVPGVAAALAEARRMLAPGDRHRRPGDGVHVQRR